MVEKISGKKKQPMDDLKYYQTEVKVIQIQLIALQQMALVDCFNFSLFDGKMSALDLVQKYDRDEMIKILVAKKETLHQTKIWLNLIHLRSS